MTMVLLAWGCDRGETRLADLEESLAVAVERPGILLVEAVQREALTGKRAGRSELVIETVTAASGALPRLRDDAGLVGLIELLDGQGEVIWSMHYQPRADGELGRLTLRAPLLPAARKVRLAESNRKRIATAPIKRP
jgi:hypothetical protein